jgi:secreted trypsin-like serine protease
MSPATDSANVVAMTNRHALTSIFTKRGDRAERGQARNHTLTAGDGAEHGQARNLTPAATDRAGRGRARSLTLAAAIGSAAIFAAATAPPANAIIGGRDATENYSFTVTLRDGKGVHYCGATLVAPQWVVTAGHCSHVPIGQVSAKVGGTNVEKGGSVRRVTKIVRHPDYTADPNDLRHDIALFKLDRPVRETPIRIAARPGAPKTQIRLLGWGMTCEDGNECPEPPTTLQELDSDIVPDSRCAGIDAASDICSQHPTKKAQSCILDSGGPMVRKFGTRWELVGITSRDGDEMTDPNCVGPGVWTDAAAYKTWIRRTTGTPHPTPA